MPMEKINESQSSSSDYNGSIGSINWSREIDATLRLPHIRFETKMVCFWVPASTRQQQSIRAMIHAVDINDYLSIFFFFGFQLLFCLLLFALARIFFSLTISYHLLFVYFHSSTFLFTQIQCVCASCLADVIYFGYCFIFWRV